MKKMVSLLVTAGTLLLVGGCASAPSESPDKARMVMDRELVEGCTYIGEVKGSSSIGGISGQQLGKVRAEAEMRYAAGHLGADVVLVHSSRGGYWGAKSSGAAYKCEGRAPAARRAYTPPTEVAPAPPPVVPGRGTGGCEKDTDCKGDRVCEDGRCVSP